MQIKNFKFQEFSQLPPVHIYISLVIFQEGNDKKLIKIDLIMTTLQYCALHISRKSFLLRNYQFFT